MMALSKRQRAMLKEMGVQVWQPLPETAAPLTLVTPPSPAVKIGSAINLGAERALNQSSAASFNAKTHPVTAEHNTNPAWRVGTAQTLYADTAVSTAARWLVLLEAPASALQDFNPLGGDAGTLLDNMLRAAKLHTAAAVHLAPLVRLGTGGDLPGALTVLFASANADVVLAMGRLVAQALLQSAEPLAKLRGQIHAVHGQKIVATLDPAYLLRNPLDKAKAWDDVCFAMCASR